MRSCGICPQGAWGKDSDKWTPELKFRLGAGASADDAMPPVSEGGGGAAQLMKGASQQPVSESGRLLTERKT